MKIKNSSNGAGFTLLELLVVVGILVIFAIMILLVLDPQTQMNKGHDSKRKTDLRKIQTALEDYYGDHRAYPATLDQLETDYLREVPTDPSTQPYDYFPTGDHQAYRIYVILAWEQDPDIEKAGCEHGCGPGCSFNYGVGSPNADLERC